MIDAAHQGKADCISLCYTTENKVARNLYAPVGFVETGEIGEEEGVEIIYARLVL
ncbi:MAG: hypothetical protein FWE21_09480 [Defluviitaleaceae bacterium]|nr:hypothetical protein [Defluviitaleaceae bacterium]